MYEVIFYKDSQGREPIKEYLYELKQKSLTSKSDRVVLRELEQARRNLKDFMERSR